MLNRDLVLITSLADALLACGATLSSAESCTGGLIGQWITSQPGSSLYYLGGAVAYANHLKSELCRVPADLIRQHGAVSAPVARAMAEGIRKVSGSTYAIATTGVAGPGGSTPVNPVGSVWMAVAKPDETVVWHDNFTGDRTAIRDETAREVLLKLLGIVKDG